MASMERVNPRSSSAEDICGQCFEGNIDISMKVVGFLEKNAPSLRALLIFCGGFSLKRKLLETPNHMMGAANIEKLNPRYWGGANTTSPIFFYLGLEGRMEVSDEVDNFIEENAQSFRALLVFTEHRYYGESYPFGSKEIAYTNSSTLKYLSSEQALADYAQLLRHLKISLSAMNSPFAGTENSYIRAICDGVNKEPYEKSTLKRLILGIRALHGDSCLRIITDEEIPRTERGWDWQVCTEMVIPIGCSSKHSMFEDSPFHLLSLTQYCQKLFGQVEPRPHWATTEYGGHAHIAWIHMDQLKTDPYWLVDQRKGRGLEGDIEGSIQVIKFLEENAPNFKALLLFAEHRYYGESYPFGSKEVAYSNSSTLKYLSSEQALADYAQLLRDLKVNLSAVNNPVIAFGCSYGGMLASWFHLKFPHIVIGALASSAPILYFDNLTPQNGYCSVVTNDFKEISESCCEIIKKSWRDIDKVAIQFDGLTSLSKMFNTCFYVKDICDGVNSDPQEKNLLKRVSFGIKAYLGDSCLRIIKDEEIPNTKKGWDWQDALNIDDKCPNALSMLGDLELKIDDWLNAKDTFRAARCY
ncbi:hypothetical protein HPP92_012148 [Vanilla planifolia]|uniref:Lysosomal Pro-X carboxypeptidase n=1 Tax=Vanilla planifolia TaxID=51239 RepID=A0A835R8A4_VANPL|nr:hypothetical protein HPP92_012148 [Vanilla planifolia]